MVRRISTVLATNGLSCTIGIWNEGWQLNVDHVSIKVSSTTTTGATYGIANEWSGGLVIRNASIESTAPGGDIEGVNSHVSQGFVSISDSRITMTDGIGLFNDWYGPVDLTNVTISSPGPNGTALWLRAIDTLRPIRINRSTLVGGVSSINNQWASDTKVGASQLAGPVSGAPVVCVGAYNENYAPLTSACQP